MRETYTLFCHRKFLPLFLTQFQEALTDNLIKCALIIMATFEIYASQPSMAGEVVGLSGALLMLPFFLFSATAGQVADKFDKAIVTRYIKGFEVFSMLLASYGFYTKNVYFLLWTVFLLGLHSTFFGPIKYSMLPQHLEKKELLAGNAFIEGGTFIAILIGSIMGNELPVLVHSGSISAGAFYVSLLGLFLAVVGTAISFFIPPAPSVAPNIKIECNIFKSTWHIIKFSKRKKKVYSAIIGMSWFWLIGMTFMTLLPSMVKETLYSTPAVYTFFLVVFSLGIAAGTMICEKVQGETIDTRYVPIGSLGMAVFSLLLCILTFVFSFKAPIHPYSLIEFLSMPLGWFIIIDIILFSIFAGFYAVPLNTVIQYWTEKDHMSRVIASLNIVSAFFMVIGALSFSVCIKSLGLSIPAILLIFGIMNIVATVYIFKKLPNSHSEEL